jgi:carbon monoxide dehydrogenase subunit G
MATITESIEINRRPDDVFAYATDFSRFAEWQGGVVSARRDGGGPLSVGTRATVMRRLGPRTLARTEEITELHPPRTWTVRGDGGPFAVTVRGTIEPLDQGSRSRLTIAFHIEGHGVGNLLVPIVRRAVQRLLPRNERKLKEILERPTARAIA